MDLIKESNTCGIKYKHSGCCFEYTNSKDDLKRFAMEILMLKS